jgi:hypothetical protein
MIDEDRFMMVNSYTISLFVNCLYTRNSHNSDFIKKLN